MRKINNYEKFLSEEVLNKIFNASKKKDSDNRIETCVDNILSFLSDNNVQDWNDFEKMTPFDRDIVNKLIDSDCINMKELAEVRFNIRLKLSNRQQLKEYLKELEETEDYEKCAKIVKKLSE